MYYIQKNKNFFLQVEDQNCTYRLKTALSVFLADVAVCTV